MPFHDDTRRRFFLVTMVTIPMIDMPIRIAIFASLFDPNSLFLFNIRSHSGSDSSRCNKNQYFLSSFIAQVICFKFFFFFLLLIISIMVETRFLSPTKKSKVPTVVSPEAVGKAVGTVVSNVPDADAIKKMKNDEIIDFFKKQQQDAIAAAVTAATTTVPSSAGASASKSMSF